jgi:hypothetical protein
MKSDLVTTPVHLHHVTEKAWLVSLDGDKAKAVWVPKSQAELETAPGEPAILTAPEWLMFDKGLI